MENKEIGTSSGELDEAEILRIVEGYYLQRIEARRTKIEEGSGDDLLAAILDVAIGRVAFPEWLSYKVASAIRRYSHHEVSTLDQAFNVKRPAGYRRKAVAARWNKAILIVRDVHDLSEHGFPIDGSLFEEVGKLHGVGKTKASEWYYFHKNNNTLAFVSMTSYRTKCESIPERLEVVARVLGRKF